MKHGRLFYYIEGERYFSQPGVDIDTEIKLLNAESGSAAFRFHRSLAKQAPESLPSEEDLLALADTMKDQEIPENSSSIEAGYTYLGQFIAHEITHNGTQYPGKNQQLCPDEILQKTSPSIDLDSLYDGAVYNRHTTYPEMELRDSVGDPGPFKNVDVPRDSGKPKIPDMRNDENIAVSQLNVAMIRFHNAVAKYCARTAPSCVLDDVKKVVIQHFQSIVLDDYLEKLIDPEIHEFVMKYGNQWYEDQNDAPNAMPIEFAMAAFRFGHSMARDKYEEWNEIRPSARLQELLSTKPPLTDFDQLESNWLLDWRKMFDLDDQIRPIRAKKIDTQLASGLITLPENTVEPHRAPSLNLAARTLLFGRAISLPDGQNAVEQINKKLAASSQKCPSPPLIVALTNDRIEPPGNQTAKTVLNNDRLCGHTPLWYYILCEAREQQCGNRLGQLGSWIVMEVLHHIVKHSEHSILKDTGWEPTLGGTINKEGKRIFKFTDLLNFSGGINPF